MPTYCTRDGFPVAANDPDRELWYGLCGYWTDDWDKVRNSGGIPCCPECRCPGFQISARQWFEGIANFEANGNPGYAAFIAELKENCLGPGKRIGDEWQKRKNQNGGA